MNIPRDEKIWKWIKCEEESAEKINWSKWTLLQEPEIESPESDTTESACCEVEGEDPNDPEWTVADDRDTEKERIRPTAKR